MKLPSTRTTRLLPAGCMMVLSFVGEVFAQGESHVTVPMAGDQLDGANPQFFFDARSTGFTKDGKQQIFDGDVIAIGPRSLVTADKVTIDEQNHYLVAEGHVIVLTNGQYITGERVQLWSDTGDVKVTSALLVVNDSIESDRIANEILGYTASEVEFEAHRRERINDVSKKKDEVRTDVRQRTKEGLAIPDDTIRDYARYLEQEDLMTRQENPAFAQMSEARRKTLRRRRDFWEQARLSDRVKAAPAAAAYFRMSGDTLERTNNNDFSARNGVWTPCYCEKDEDPAWSFRSSTMMAQPGGYATFNNAVLEIKGVPILYFPWLRVPIKDKRQSGLLMPAFSSDAASGSVYSQPLFLDLGTDKDVTVKTDLFERRGTRVGAEARYQHRKYSGFQLNGEVMQDRVWLNQRANRQDLRDIYFEGLDAARTDTSGLGADALSSYSGRDFARMRLRQRQFWDTSPWQACVAGNAEEQRACEAQLNGRLRAPNNNMRGSFRWSGQERITSRLSLVTTGEMYSDRHYNTDLYVPESFQAGFDTGSGERALQPARAQLHYDGRDYYLGLGSSYGDNVLKNDRYEGYQLPSVVKAKSRWFRLGNTGVPIYGSTSLDQYRILSLLGSPQDPEASTALLPSAWWRKASTSFVVPLATDTAVQVDHFTDMEARHISFDAPRSQIKDSSIQSLRSGFRIQLPIDGKRPLPGWLGGSEIRGEDGTRMIQHMMNWSMTLTARPSVVRRGPYGQADGPLAGLAPTTFMATDMAGEDENIKPEDYLNEYQLVTFATTHRWKIFNELWKRLEPTGKLPEADKDKNISTPTWEERARRELLYSIDQPVRGDGEIFSEDQTKWFINRYQLLDTDYQEPVNFSANITYDYLKEVNRRKYGQTRANRPWNEPEGRLGVNAFNWSASAYSRYNLYDRAATKHTLSLVPPGLFSSNVSFSYTLERSPYPNSDGGWSYSETREKTVSLVTSLTKPISTTWTYSQKEVKDAADPYDYRQKIGLIYASSSRCWGLGFSREKNYGNTEQNASYLLQLSVVFMGQARDLPNMSGPMEREIKKS